VGLTLPSELTEPLGRIGLTWPEADEELLFEAGQQWISFGQELAHVALPANTAAGQVWATGQGEAVEAFQEWWTDQDGPRTRLAEDAAAAMLIGAALMAFAAITLALKIAFIIQLIILAIQVAQAIATAFVTFGATTAEVPGFIAATRLICRKLIQQVIDHITTVIKDILRKAKNLLKKAEKRVLARAERRALDEAGHAASELASTAGHALTDADRAALHHYTTSAYRDINEVLRGSSGLPPWEQGEIRATADRISEGLAKLPAQPGTTYRGVTYSDDVLARYQPGSVVTEHAFTSTSRDAAVAQGTFDGNVLMNVTGRNGRDVASFSTHPEAEILYDKGTRFRVTDRTWESDIGTWVITMKEM
jgi:hypothetical protein